MSLPSGYRQLEYIQSTGTQYIDTGYASSSGFIADIRLSITSFSSSYQCIMGSHNLASPWGRNCIAKNSNKIEVGLCGVSSLTYTLTENTPYLISFSSVIPSGFVKVDGTTIQSYASLVSSSDGGSTLSENNVLIGANQYTVSNNINTLPAKWYYIKLYDASNTLIRDYVPCKNPSGEIGLYDLVNQQFYGNAGTGTFIAGSPLNFKKGDVLNFDYTGAAQSITLPPGTYKLQCWGAQGGYRSSSAYGGKGGYSVGTLTLLEKTMLYLYVGGSPGGSTSSVGTSKATTGGFNGGGYRTGYPGGGGASDIRIGTDSLYARVIVAGGGGSCGATSKKGMYGGGETGGSSTESYSGASNYCGKGGTQTYSGYSAAYTATTQVTAYTSTTSAYYGGFGFGGYGLYRSNGYGGAGGGGWYGGSGNYPDSSGDDDRGGGGGSGYIYTTATASNYPSGCLLNSNYYLSDAQTIAGNTSFPSTSGGTETGHQGNGYISITVINVKSLNLPANIGGSWKDSDECYVKVNDVWKTIDSMYVKVNNVWKELSS